MESLDIREQLEEHTKSQKFNAWSKNLDHEIEIATYKPDFFQPRSRLFCLRTVFMGDLRQGVSIVALLILSLIVWKPVSASEQPLPEKSPQRYDWEHVLEDLKIKRNRLSSHLQTAHKALLPRALKDEPELVKKLSLDPPQPRPNGYGILPPIRQNESLKTVMPSEQSYSLEELSRWVKEDLRDGVYLVERVRTNPVPALESLAAEFERLNKRLRNLEEHLTYHAKWQKTVIEQDAIFSERNRILGLVREMQVTLLSGHSPKRVAILRQKINETLAPFSHTRGLAIQTLKNGLQLLEVSVYTDIEDDEFLAAFREGVEEAFVRSEAAHTLHFSVKLGIRKIPPDALYPEGIPARGTAIDMTEHLARFPADALIITTGGKYTYARIGRNITLGSNPITRRELAHEFGHLLGFSDAYLRAYDGDVEDPWGVVLVEWSGLVDNLMGASRSGRVTKGMINRLIEAYGKH
jgi:hypothetical protein